MQDLDWLAPPRRAPTSRFGYRPSRRHSAGAFRNRIPQREVARSHIENREAVLKARLQSHTGQGGVGVKVFGCRLYPCRRKRFAPGRNTCRRSPPLTRRAADRASPELLVSPKRCNDCGRVAEGGKLLRPDVISEFHKTLLPETGGSQETGSLVRSYSRKWKNKRRVECTGPWPHFRLFATGLIRIDRWRRILPRLFSLAMKNRQI